MEKQWTPEPWRIDTQYGTMADVTCVLGADNDTVMDNEAYYPASVSVANMHRATACVNACADIPKPEGISEAIRVLEEEADLLLKAIGHVPGINEARKRFILAQSKALRAMGLEP